ncbi:hypothetical protein ABK040_014770 [Willaertia magna]
MKRRLEEGDNTPFEKNQILKLSEEDVTDSNNNNTTNNNNDNIEQNQSSSTLLTTTTSSSLDIINNKTTNNLFLQIPQEILHEIFDYISNLQDALFLSISCKTIYQSIFDIHPIFLTLKAMKNLSDFKDYYLKNRHFHHFQKISDPFNQYACEKNSLSSVTGIFWHFINRTSNLNQDIELQKRKEHIYMKVNDWLKNEVAFQYGEDVVEIFMNRIMNDFNVRKMSFMNKFGLSADSNLEESINGNKILDYINIYIDFIIKKDDTFLLQLLKKNKKNKIGSLNNNDDDSDDSDEGFVDSEGNRRVANELCESEFEQFNAIFIKVKRRTVQQVRTLLGLKPTLIKDNYENDEEYFILKKIIFDEMIDALFLKIKEMKYQSFGLRLVTKRGLREILYRNVREEGVNNNNLMNTFKDEFTKLLLSLNVHTFLNDLLPVIESFEKRFLQEVNDKKFTENRIAEKYKDLSAEQRLTDKLLVRFFICLVEDGFNNKVLLYFDDEKEPFEGHKVHSLHDSDDDDDDEDSDDEDDEHYPFWLDDDDDDEDDDDEGMMPGPVGCGTQ